MSQNQEFLSTTVYADFADPRAYLASLRVDALLAAGHPALQWRSVQHRPTLPLRGVRLDGSAHDVRGNELRHACDSAVLGEHFEARNPTFLPHTAIAAAVHATAVELGRGPEVRRLLLDGYWVRGLDIGDTSVVRHLIKPILEDARPGGTAKEHYLRLQSGAAGIANTWQQEWLAMGTPVELTVVNSRHNAAYGIDALNRLCHAQQLAA